MFEQPNRSFSQTGKFGELWCVLMHDSPMWPIHNHYQCRRCGRQYPVPWAEARAAVPSGNWRARVPSPRSALLLVVILATMGWAPNLGAEQPPVPGAEAGPALAFARYLAGGQSAGPWRLETIEINASLPKLGEQGRMLARRQLLPIGPPEYQVLEIAGDRTVKQQVISRYLSEDERASNIPPSSVAVTPANYRFRYKGPVETGEGLAYAFRITPRRKRAGLIKGELWLNAETGVAVRQSGYLVKRPSLFVKRIDVTRETRFRDGIAEVRVTHVAVETRMVGRAELRVEERPFPATDSVSSSAGQ